jgi:hypothetical protein
MYRKDGLAAIEEELEVRAFLGAECYALPGQPPQELRTLHDLIVYIFVYPRKGMCSIIPNFIATQEEKGQPAEADCPF